MITQLYNTFINLIVVLLNLIIMLLKADRGDAKMGLSIEIAITSNMVRLK